jgi:hypothetical protein
VHGHAAGVRVFGQSWRRAAPWAWGRGREWEWVGDVEDNRGKGAPCGMRDMDGLYAPRVQIGSGRQIARWMGTTSVKQAVRRRNMSGGMVQRSLRRNRI